MFKTYEFSSSSFELPIERKKPITCKVWEANNPSPSIVLIEYDLGKDLDDLELKTFAEHIVTTHNMSVVSIEYAETKIKKSPDLLSKLETLLPEYLKKISSYLSNRHQELIKTGALQDVINDLQFNPYIKIPVNKDTIIPLYGDENSYTDFGIVASLDILTGLEKLKKQYPNWLWNDCIGVGIGYGSYIIQLAERLLPNTFSLLIGKNSIVKPTAADIFANRTEIENGNKQYYYEKNIGEFKLYLNESQGWTSAEQHPFYFEQRHYDIRNLENETLMQRSGKETPHIFIDEIRANRLEEKINYVEKLINYNFPVELFVPDKEEIDGQTVYIEDGEIVVRFDTIFDQYLEKNYSRNKHGVSQGENSIFPVKDGVYVFINLNDQPQLVFIPAFLQVGELSEYEYICQFLGENTDELKQELIEELYYYLKKPLDNEDIKYRELIQS